MNVQQLIEELENLNPEAEVRLAFQPSWPFEHSISQVVEQGDPRDEYEVLRDDAGWNVERVDGGGVEAGPFETFEEAEQARFEIVSTERGEQEATKVVYIAEGHQIGYLPGIVSRELGWR